MENTDTDLESRVVTYVPDGAPEYGAKTWSTGSALNKQNCMTYALDIPLHGWGIPGDLLLSYTSGYLSRAQKTVEAFKGLLLNDGLESVESFNKAATDIHLIAAFVRSGFGFHFYRQDRDALWSHKIGGDPVERQDALGRVITDPRMASKEDDECKEFVGFFAVPKTGLSYCDRVSDFVIG